MKIYGYARISTKQQNIERQIRNILAVDNTAMIFQEVFTGTKFQDRPELKKLLKRVKPNDTIIFDSVSRMSRNAEEGFREYKKLFNDGINLLFLKEPHINTDTYRQATQNKIEISIDSGDKDTDSFVDDLVKAVNKYISKLLEKQIQLAFEQSEKEVSDLHQRTSEGLLTAKENGKQIGQIKGVKLTTKKSLKAKEIIKKHNKDFGGSLNNEETWNQAKISKMTFYKYKAELFAEGV